MAKTTNNSQEKKLYEVIKEFWFDGVRYLAGQLIKLTDREAKEWLDRRCIKLVNKLQNEIPQGENSIPTTESEVGKTTKSKDKEK